MEHIVTMTEAAFIPDDPRILQHSSLVAPGTSDTRYFTAPIEPGPYPYVCTFPGHHLTMRGILHVRKKLPLPDPGRVAPAEAVDEFSLIVGDTPVIQRGPFEGGGAASICVGAPNGVSFAFDTESGTINHIWLAGSDGFLDTKAAWGGRGGKALKALGEMRFVRAKSGDGPSQARFKFYEILDSGLPAFHFDDGTSLLVEVAENLLIEHFHTAAGTEIQSTRHALGK
jgi:hypothetical protein